MLPHTQPCLDIEPAALSCNGPYIVSFGTLHVLIWASVVPPATHPNHQLQRRGAKVIQCGNHFSADEEPRSWLRPLAPDRTQLTAAIQPSTFPPPLLSRFLRQQVNLHLSTRETSAEAKNEFGSYNRVSPLLVQVRRVHARRVSSTSQTAKGSFEEREEAMRFSPPADATTRKVEKSPKSQLQATKAPLQVQSAVIPPFTVRDPVEKQVQNWLANTSDEYNILLNRKNAYKTTARNQKAMENRSLELRQASCDSNKKFVYDPSSQKRPLRLWKQTTPMSHAIIQNHLEQRSGTNISSAGSPLLRELTVPSFGFDSGEGSMLHSLEENPQEDLLSLPPPVSTQRRFSDNPLTAKTCACTYQVELPPKLTYSSQQLAPQVKLQSAPVRSFCCLFHRQHSFCDPCGQHSHPKQLPNTGHMRPHWSDSLTETSHVYQKDYHPCTHNCANTYSEVEEMGAERITSSSNRLTGVGDPSSVEDIAAPIACQSVWYGYQPLALRSLQTNVNHPDIEDWKVFRSGGVVKKSDCLPLSNRPLSSGSFSRNSTKQADIESCASPKRHMPRMEQRMSRQLHRVRLKNSRSNSRHEENLGFVSSDPSPSAKGLECEERVNETVLNLTETLHDMLQCQASELDVRQSCAEQALSNLDGQTSEADDRAVFATPMSRLIPPDLIFSPASRRVSAVDINDTLEASGDMRMLTVSSPRQLSRQNSIHSIEDMVQLGDTYLGGCGGGDGAGVDGVDPVHSLTPQSSLSSEKIFLKPQYAATPPELQRRILGDTGVQHYGVSHARSFDQFGRQVISGARHNLHSAQPSPIRVGPGIGFRSVFHRAASHSPSLTPLDRQLVQHSLTPRAESEQAQSPPILRTQLGKPVHKSEVDICGQQSHLRYLRRRIDVRNQSSPNSQGFTRMVQYNSEESGCYPRFLSPSEPTSIHGPTEGGSSCRTPEFFSLDSSNSDPTCQQEVERPTREPRQYISPESNVSPCATTRLGREGLQSVHCLSGVDQTAPQDPRSRCGSRPLDRTAVSLTTSADCLTTERMKVSHPSTSHHRLAKSVHKHPYISAVTTSRCNSHLSFGPKKNNRRSGNELHPRKSLEVVSAWSSSCSPSTQSTRPSSRRDSLARKLGINKALSSEVDGRGDHGPNRQLFSLVTDKRRQSKTSVETTVELQQPPKCHFRRDYTIDAKTDQLFQAFLQHDPSLDKTCIPQCTSK
uniref:Uncharacterized protein n=1 Tax=Schistocephalus solidus TaxID=70667 RepID=A0A0X3PRE4_SCHSO